MKMQYLMPVNKEIKEFLEELAKDYKDWTAFPGSSGGWLDFKLKYIGEEADRLLKKSKGE